MCIIIAKHAEKKFDIEKIKFSQKSNEDGYGAMWYDESLKTYHTLDFEEYLAFLDTNNGLEAYNAVLHLRYATVGDVTITGCHPFDIGIGQMMHNGTIYSFKPNYNDPDKTKSDSSEIASSIKSLVSTSSLGILRTDGFNTFLLEAIGTTINRIVIMDKAGNIHIYNEDLGNIVDGIWYSNDYHFKERYVAPPPAKTNSGYQTMWDNYTEFLDVNDYTWEDVGYAEYTKGIRDSKRDKKTYTPKESAELCTNVFVYGTLKENFYNNSWLLDAKKLHSAETSLKWAMIGKDMAYPYMIEESDEGYFVKGELWEADKEIIESLDHLEGYPHHYTKKIIDVHDEAFNFSKAWVYYAPDHEYEVADLIEEFKGGRVRA